ncbi:hypothetical protein [Kaistella jeonii]|uniref:Lipoprotein n=1 Tax=Kaistella jeonii TaxID=266749 RepID=A0A0C1D5K9_9FLAO|nr:hypothetical protein [Kaistella jeonii]KIA89030.1 hypothetical protein OA86_08105 [Kaistella jeonii]SFB96173.1 hypothetical protein SAMN05421876_104143 [Kaistella jeonii]VEI97172.1 Uncharacterised protein [Kaistella jeonii]
MKNLIILSFIAVAVISCDKIEEKISSVVTETTEKAQQKAKETIQESVTEQIGKIVNSENIQFDQIFPHQNNLSLENIVGKKVAFPNGTPFYVFKYKAADKNLLLSTLVEQHTSNEAQSKKEFQKVDGTSIIEKITFFEKFLPPNSIDLSFLDDIKNDKNIEYYKVKRFPNASTIIYNPKNEMVYQFVEVKK